MKMAKKKPNQKRWFSTHLSFINPDFRLALSEVVDVETKKYEWLERTPVSFLARCDLRRHTQGHFLSLPQFVTGRWEKLSLEQPPLRSSSCGGLAWDAPAQPTAGSSPHPETLVG